MRIHVLSDLHIEFEDFEPPAVEADLVVLAGDVDLGVRGVRWAKEAFAGRPVVYVPGNHEYYRNSIPDLTDKLRVEAAHSNVHVLDNDIYEFGGISILGSTLWTDLALYGNAAAGAASVADVMVDYRAIRVSPKYRRLTPADTAAFHRKAVAWLRSELSGRSGSSVVVTHHAPSEASLSPFYKGDPVNAAFASNLENLVAEFEPALWVHGHSHHNVDYSLGATRVICNPRGYPDEQGAKFDPALVVGISG